MNVVVKTVEEVRSKRVSLELTGAPEEVQRTVEELTAGDTFRDSMRAQRDRIVAESNRRAHEIAELRVKLAKVEDNLAGMKSIHLAEVLRNQAGSAEAGQRSNFYQAAVDAERELAETRKELARRTEERDERETARADLERKMAFIEAQKRANEQALKDKIVQLRNENARLSGVVAERNDVIERLRMASASDLQQQRNAASDVKTERNRLQLRLETVIEERAKISTALSRVADHVLDESTTEAMERINVEEVYVLKAREVLEEVRAIVRPLYG